MHCARSIALNDPGRRGYGCGMRILVLGGFGADAEPLASRLPDDEVVSLDATGDPGAVGQADVIVPLMGRVDAALLGAVRPRLIQQFGAGVEGIDLDAATTRGVAVANVPSDATHNAAAVAELAVMHLLILSRRAAEAAQAVADGHLGTPVGRSLHGQTAVILGMGGVGRHLAGRLRPFGVHLIGVGRRPAREADPAVLELLDGYRRVSALRDVLAGASLVVLCLPLTAETRGIIGAAELSVMPAGGIVVNVGRGPLIDHDALREALRSGHLGGAGLDVFWHEPIDPTDPVLTERVSVSAHVGGVVTQVLTENADAVAANLERLRTGGALAHRIR